MTGDTTLTMPVQPTGYAANNSNGWGGDWSSWIIIFLIFAMFGWGGYGGMGNRGATSGGVTDGYVLTSDFANIERKLDGVNSGLCDGFYAQNTSTLNGFAGVQSALTQGFAGINTALNTSTNTIQQAVQAGTVANMRNTNAIQTQLADCCCNTQQAIREGITQGAMNTNALQSAIKDSACENEKIAMQSRFDNAQASSTTLQAIDKVGDRIIDYLAADKAQTLRDENQALRLAASQAAQNNYLVNQLRPSPIPAYTVTNPYCCNGYYNTGCGYNA